MTFYYDMVNPQKVDERRQTATQITLKAARVNAGFTQRSAAERLGVTPGTLVSWEKNRTAPNASIFRKLCEIYDVSEDLIFLPKTTT